MSTTGADRRPLIQRLESYVERYRGTSEHSDDVERALSLLRPSTEMVPQSAELVERIVDKLHDVVVRRGDDVDHSEPPDPTPERLRAWAEWFDSPHQSPAMAILVGSRTSRTPGYLLREIAQKLEDTLASREPLGTTSR